MTFQKFILIYTFVKTTLRGLALSALDKISLFSFANLMNKNDTSYLLSEHLLATYISPSMNCLFMFSFHCQPSYCQHYLLSAV